eukprot:6579922-Lingulodinium_polyedra.AAC.1
MEVGTAHTQLFETSLNEDKSFAKLELEKLWCSIPMRGSRCFRHLFHEDLWRGQQRDAHSLAVHL